MKRQTRGLRKLGSMLLLDCYLLWQAINTVFLGCDTRLNINRFTST